MKNYRKILESQTQIDPSFKDLEDPKVADVFEYRFLSLKKAPKEASIIIKTLKKHLKTPLRSLSWKSGSTGEMNLAVYSPSKDGMQFNLSNAKKLKKGTGKVVRNFNDELESHKISLSKWEAYQSKLSPTHKKELKKARGSINRLKVSIRNLERKISTGETPAPNSSLSYTSNVKDAIEITVLHELAHRYTNTKQIDKHKAQVYFNRGQFPTEYSKRNLIEYIAEIYALVKMKLLDKTPMSDESKIYFKKEFKGK